MSTEFRVGDECLAYGLKCVVVSMDFTSKWSVCIKLLEGEENEKLLWFLPDGRQYGWHKEPSLKLVKRAKEKVMMQMYYSPLVKHASVMIADIDSIPAHCRKIGEPFEVEVDE